jgi:hypothetical protein
MGCDHLHIAHFFAAQKKAAKKMSARIRLTKIKTKMIRMPLKFSEI